MKRQGLLAFPFLAFVALIIVRTHAQRGNTAVIPKTWDDQAIATLEVPMANPIGSPTHASAEYYYRIPVAAIFKSYPVYAPGHEPPGYLDKLREQEPVVVWDDAGHAPPLETETDWIAGGEIVFDAPTTFDSIVTLDRARDPVWYREVGTPVARDGTVPFFRYVVRKKGVVEVGQSSCGQCHIRVLPDGGVLKGAQGNFNLNRAVSYQNRIRFDRASDRAQFLAAQRLAFKAQWAVPWLSPDPAERIGQMSFEELEAANARPAGVAARQRTSVFSPVQVPDLIGVKDRRYLDRTGLQQHRSIADLMRYAAMNRGAFAGGDLLANHNGFIPADRTDFKRLPDPSTQIRYSDEQLHAMALYMYALQPPQNPNTFNALAARGQQVFTRAGCATCHTPPLYTNNKLTPAVGFTIPPDHLQKYDILPISVGTDPDLALKTRRGTGYYKVPSLKGVWYRGMFGHSGWCATLEDWFDPRRVRDDYVPTGWKPYDRRTYAVKGHTFGLALSEDDRRALIAFLRTL
jgi:Di-haem oxidoreductase, putative peroxidase